LSAAALPALELRRRLRGQAFLAAFTADLIELELDGLDAAARRDATDWVLDRIEGGTDLARIGFGAIATCLSVAVRACAGRRYESLPRERRLQVARKLLASRLPGIGELVRGTRALAISHAFEERFPQ
jgi:hypothetical protein